MTHLSNSDISCSKTVLTISKKKIRFCHIVLTIILLFLFVLSANSNETYPKLSSPLTEENVAKWDAYVFSNAKTNDRYKVANTVIRKYQSKGKWGMAIQKILEYLPHFNNDTEKSQYKALKKMISRSTLYFMMKTPQREDFPILDKFIKDNKNTYDGFVGVRLYAGFYSNIQKWDSAKVIWEAYKPLFPDFEELIEKSISVIMKPSTGLQVSNYGENLNTRYDEWDPTLSPDGETIYFSSTRSGGYGGSDVWYSKKINGEWSNPKNIGPDINDVYNETVDNISPDGNTLFLSGNFEGTFGNFDIYTSSKTKDGWGDLEHFPMPINTGYTDESCNLSSDGNVLIFTSDRPGGVGEYLRYGAIKHGSQMGNMDIWISKKTDDGSWGDPINLGDVINTPYAERAPFLHPDGKTLYFSSNGHHGLGKLDVFKSTRLSDTSWLEWSEPINLGKEINTVEDDWGYFINANGEQAIFAANNRTIGFGGWDMFKLILPEDLKPQEICQIMGFVKDKNGEPLQATIEWEDLSTNELIGSAKSDPATGKFFLNLPLGKFYGYFAEKEGYYPKSNNVDLRNLEAGKFYRLDIEMMKIEDMKAESVTLNNIFFDFDKSTLRSESFPELNRLAELLSNDQSLELQIEGHTDKKGSSEYNLELSKARAEAVKEFLKNKGINTNRLETFGYGYDRPAYPEVGDEPNPKNRRVEIRLKN